MSPALPQFLQRGDSESRIGDNWATGACATGQRQSPIDIVTSVVETTDLTLDTKKIGAFTDVPVHIADHAVKAVPKDVSNKKFTAFTDDDGTEGNYNFIQMHFHAPSEHTVDSIHYDAEIHFVHAKSDTELLVIGVFFDVLDGTPGDSWLLEDFDLFTLETAEEEGEHEYEAPVFDIKSFLEKLESHEFYHYEGSLTTPTCDEIVEWIVYKTPVFISPKNFDILESHLGESNRNTQPLNGRKIRLGDNFGARLSINFIALVLSLVFF